MEVIHKMQSEDEVFDVLKDVYYVTHKETYKGIQFTVGFDILVGYSVTMTLDYKILCELMGHIDPTTTNAEVSVSSTFMNVIMENLITSQGECFTLDENKCILFIRKLGCTPASRNIPTHEMLDICIKKFDVSKTEYTMATFNSASLLVDRLITEPDFLGDKVQVNGIDGYKVNANEKTYVMLTITESLVIDRCRKVIDRFTSLKLHSKLIDRINSDLKNKRRGGIKNESKHRSV